MNIYFDLDGPLLDISERYYMVYKSICDRYGFCSLSKDKYWKLKKSKTPVEQILALSGARIEVDEYIKDRLQLIETKEFIQYDRLFTFTHKVLVELKQSCRLVLVTLRSNYENLMWELKKFEIDRYFDQIYSGNDHISDWRVKKELILKDPLLNSHVSLVVGDTEVDILAGKDLKMNQTIAVLSGIRNRESLATFKPDLIIQDISRLPLIVESITKEKR